MQPLLIYLRWGISADSEAPCYSNSLSGRVSSSSVTESRQKVESTEMPPTDECMKRLREAPASPSLPSGESCVKQGATLPGPPELEQEAATAVSSPSLEKSCELADHRVTSILSLWFWGPEAVFPALLLGMKSCGSHTPTFNCIPEGDVHIQKDCLPAGCCPGEWHVPHAASRMWGEVGSSGGPQDQDRAQDQSSSWPHVLSTGRGSILVSLLTVGLRGSARRRLTLQKPSDKEGIRAVTEGDADPGFLLQPGNTASGKFSASQTWL
ncbi:unnamed protein product [Rangifer tarandus platyrhynchus]|uniref:Uncharacterized protein n=1 Tax=Rangifer tarandus platyrhynchus TaxID=3082113 RepID=A0ABN8ZT58_RANTA|nr:unnamed protein product [Rangifer tarandus platyrhynchus]